MVLKATTLRRVTVVETDAVVVEEVVEGFNKFWTAPWRYCRNTELAAPVAEMPVMMEVTVKHWVFAPIAWLFVKPTKNV